MLADSEVLEHRHKIRHAVNGLTVGRGDKTGLLVALELNPPLQHVPAGVNRDSQDAEVRRV
jgi:hypothetical protein